MGRLAYPDRKGDDMNEYTPTTQTGITIIDCSRCGESHPETRVHCNVCGIASLFSHAVHTAVWQGADDE